MFTRRPGTHRGPAASSPVATERLGGPRRWKLSVGVLVVLAGIGAGGSWALGSARGETSSGASQVVPQPAPSRWNASTLGILEQAVPEVSPTSASTSAAAADAENGVTAADRAAGVAHRTVVQVGTGHLTVVPGSATAPRPVPFMTVRVEVEDGIGVDPQAFASFVLDTLNDSRSWGHGGALSFARTDGAADIRVVLASPTTSTQLCAPLRTNGVMSCGGGGRAVFTSYRWIDGIDDYGADRTGYRQYLVNHEVGHVLGHGHAYCTPGHVAPVMMQQTKGLKGCLANSWPFP